MLIKEHEEMAGIKAAGYADRCLERGNMRHRSIMLRVVKAIEDMKAEKPDDTVH